MGVVQSDASIEQSKPEVSLKIKLKTSVAQYFALRLMKQQTVEQQAVQQNEGPKELQDFNISPFSRLVNKFNNSVGLDLDSAPITNSSLSSSNSKFSLPIDLTEAEVSLAISNIGTPDSSNLEEVATYNQMVEDFNKSLKSARNMIKIINTINRIEGFFTGKK